LTLTKLATHSASLVKSNFCNFDKSIYTRLDTPLFISGSQLVPNQKGKCELNLRLLALFRDAHIE